MLTPGPTFAEWLIERMRERSLRGVDITRASGGAITASQVSRWVNGHATPAIASSFLLADALDLPHAEVVAAVAETAPVTSGTTEQTDEERVEVAFDGERWRREQGGEVLVAKQLSDLLDEHEAPDLDPAASSEAIAAATQRWADAVARIEQAQEDRTEALVSLIDAGMTADDLARLIGTSTRAVHKRLQVHSRRRTVQRARRR